MNKGKQRCGLLGLCPAIHGTSNKSSGVQNKVSQEAYLVGKEHVGFSSFEVTASPPEEAGGGRKMKERETSLWNKINLGENQF